MSVELSAAEEEAKPDVSRPRPVAIIALLILAGSVFALVAGVATYVQRDAFLSILRNQPGGSSLRAVTPDLVVNFAVILAGYGIIHLAIAFGLWAGRNWARRVSLALSFVGLIVFLPAILLLPEIAIPVVAFAGFVLYYFTRPRVKAFFKY